MDQLVLVVHANMGLHNKVPLITFLRLMLLRITLFLFILGRTRCGDDRGINNRTSVYFQNILLQALIDQRKELIAQIVWLYQMAEVTDGRFIRSRFIAQINTDEFAHHARIIDRFLSRRIRQIKPVLQKTDPQYTLDTNRAATSALCLRIIRFNGVNQSLPGNNGFHIVEKLLFASFLAMFFEAACE